jgi:hypothetical protein
MGARRLALSYSLRVRMDIPLLLCFLLLGTELPMLLSSTAALTPPASIDPVERGLIWLREEVAGLNRRLSIMDRKRSIEWALKQLDLIDSVSKRTGREYYLDKWKDWSRIRLIERKESYMSIQLSH